MVRFTLCNHIFHKECLDTWILKHENCPLCRTKMSKYDIEKKIIENKNETLAIYNDTIM